MVRGEFERPDRDVQLEAGERAREADRACVDVAACALKLGDDVQRRDLRRAGHRAGRERGADEGGVVGGEGKGSAHVGDEVPHPGVGAGVGDGVGDDSAGAAHATEVVADEVDDHHVLGAVLDRRAERLARFGGGFGFGRLSDRALDRRAADMVAAPLEEQLGGEARHRTPGAAEERSAVRAQRLDAGEEQVERVTIDPRVKPDADVGLEQVAGVDPPSAGLDGALVAERTGGAAPWLGRERPGWRLRCVGAGGQVGSAGREPRVGLLAPQGLKPPLPVVVLAQHVVVVGEREVRQGGRRRRSGGDGLESAAESVTEVADPAAADSWWVVAGSW